MGIYSNGSIFGIRMYLINGDDFSTVLFEEKYDEIMNLEQMKNVYLFYTGLELNDKSNVHFQFYTNCSSTLDIINKENFMTWYPLSLSSFVEKFNI